MNPTEEASRGTDGEWQDNVSDALAVTQTNPFILLLAEKHLVDRSWKSTHYR